MRLRICPFFLFAIPLLLAWSLEGTAVASTEDTAMRRSIVAERFGHYDEALEALASAEASPRTTMRRARLLGSLGDYEHARICYESLLEDRRPPRELADQIATGWILSRRLFQGYGYHARKAKETPLVGQQWMALVMAVAGELRDGVAQWYELLSKKLHSLEDLEALAELMRGNGYERRARDSYRQVMTVCLAADRLDPGRLWCAGQALLALGDDDTVAKADLKLIRSLDLATDFEYPASRYFARSDTRRILARLLRHHRGKGTLPTLREAIESLPARLHGHLVLAVLESDLGERARALSALKAARADVPDTRVFPVLTVGAFMNQLGYPEAAVVTLTDALNALPDGVDRAKAEVLYPELTGSSRRLRRLSSTVQLSIARIHGERQAPLDAVDTVTRALLVDPSNEEARTCLLELTVDRRLRRRALGLVEQSLARKDDDELQGLHARLLLDEGQITQAEAAFARYLPRALDEPTMGSLRLAKDLGRIEEARSLALRTLRRPVDSSWKGSYVWLARQGDPHEAALALATTLPSLHPGARLCATLTLTELVSEIPSWKDELPWKALQERWTPSERALLRSLIDLVQDRRSSFRKTIRELASQEDALTTDQLEALVDESLRRDEGDACRDFLDQRLQESTDHRRRATLHLLRARCIGNGKDRPKALLDYAMALQLLPGDREVHELLLDHLGNRLMRRPFVQGVLEKVEGRHEFYPFLTRYFEREGKYNLAAAFAKVAQRFLRRDGDLHMEWLKLLTAAGQEEKAMHAAEKDSRDDRVSLERLTPFLIELYGLLGQRSRFFAFASRMLPRPTFTPLLLPAFTRIVLRNGWLADGTALLEALLSEQPEQIRFAASLARIFEEVHDEEGSIRVLWKGLENAGLPHRLPIETETLLGMERRLEKHLSQTERPSDRLRLAWLRVGRRPDDLAARLDLGRFLRDSGDLDGAQEQYRLVLEGWDPLDGLPPRRQLLRERLDVARKRGLLQARVKELEEMRRDRELDTPLLEEYELGLRLLGREEAAETLREALETILVHEERWESLAAVLLETDRPERAARILLAAAEDRPRDRLTSKRLASAAEAFARAGCAADERSTLDRLALAFPATEDGRQALKHLGNLDLKAENWEAAASHLSRYLAGRPESDPQATRDLVLARQKLGRPEGATAVVEVFVRRALRQGLQIPLAMLNLAAEQSLGADAPESLQRSMAKLLRRSELGWPKSDEPDRKRLVVLRHHLEGAHLARQIQVHGSNNRITLGLNAFRKAQAHMRDGRFGEAAAAYLKAALQDPPVLDLFGNRIVITAMYRRGCCLEGLGKTDAAEACYEKAACYVQAMDWDAPENDRRLAREAFHRIRRSRHDSTPIMVARKERSPAGSICDTASADASTDTTAAAAPTVPSEGNAGDDAPNLSDGPDERSLDDIAENALDRDNSLSTFTRAFPKTAMQGLTLLFRGASALRSSLAGLFGFPPLSVELPSTGGGEGKQG